MTRSVGRRALVLLVALALLAGCSGGGDGSDALRDWASDEFTGSGGRYTSTKSVAAVASAFTAHRRPIDRHDSQGRIFLQYPDDIVAIAPAGAILPEGTTTLPGTPTTPPLPPSLGLTTIEIDGSRTGRRRHFFFIGNRWGRYQSYTDISRGGGPGYGK